MTIVRVCGQSPLLFRPKFDKRPIPCLAQPVLKSFVGLTRANCVARTGALSLFRHAFGAPLDNLYQMPAKRTLHRCGNFIVAQLIHCAFEFRHRVARRNPTQVTAFRVRWIVGMHFGQFGKIGSADHAFAQARQALFRIGVGHAFLALDQDVTHVGLLNRRLGADATFVQQLDDMKAIRATQNIGNLASFQGSQCIQEYGGQAA